MLNYLKKAETKKTKKNKKKQKQKKKKNKTKTKKFNNSRTQTEVKRLDYMLIYSFYFRNRKLKQKDSPRN